MTAVATPSPAQATAPRRHGLGQIVGRLGWGVADQAVASLSNFALGVFVARSFGADTFGAFTLAYVTYSVVINASRGLATDPMLVRFSGSVRRPWRRATAAATATALLVGITVGSVCVLAGLLLPDPVGPVFVALGVALPGLTLQDSWRFAFFAGHRGAAALLNDLAWTAMLLLALVGLHLQGSGSAVTCLLAFGGTASLAAVLGAVQAGVVPRPDLAPDWLRSHRQLSVRYLVENLSISGASQLRSFAVGGLVGLAAVGYVRASEILMGPFLVLLMGISQVAVPEASRVFHRPEAGLARFCLLLGGVQAGAAALWGLVLVLVFPLGPGMFVLKDLWQPTLGLLPAVTLTVMAASFTTAATAGLRAMGVARRSMRTQLIASTAYLVGGAGGAALGGALGTSWGVTAAQTFSALLWWHQLRSALADHSRSAGEGP